MPDGEPVLHLDEEEAQRLFPRKKILKYVKQTSKKQWKSQRMTQLRKELSPQIEVVTIPLNTIPPDERNALKNQNSRMQTALMAQIKDKLPESHWPSNRHENANPVHNSK